MDSYLFNTLAIIMSPRYILYLFLLFVAFCYAFLSIRSLSVPFRFLSYYIALIFFGEISSKYCAVHFENNMPIYHVLIPLQMLFYSQFYARVLDKKKGTQHLVQSLGLIFITLSLANSLFVQNIFSLPSNGIILLVLLVIPLILTHFRMMILYPSELRLSKHPMFWFNLGGLVFYCLTFFVFGYYNMVGEPPEWSFILIWGANMVMYGFYLYSLYLDVTNKSKVNQ